MIMRAWVIALGVMSLSLSIAGQQTERLEQSPAISAGEIDQANQFDAAAALLPFRREIVSTLNSSALLDNLTMLSLWEDRLLPVSTGLGQMGTIPADLFPVALMSPVRTEQPVGRMVSTKNSLGPAALSPSSRIYYGGEIGVFYGRSTGRSGSEEFGTYLMGQVGDDKTQINVGVSYDKSSWRAPRSR